MGLYFYMFLMVIYFLLIYLNDKKENSKIIIYFIIILLIFIGGFRIDVGRDFSMYQGQYNVLTNYNFFEVVKQEYPMKTEIGYALLNWINYKVGFGFQGVVFISQLITVIFVFKSINYYLNDKQKKVLAIIVFISLYYFSSFNLIRQNIAMAIYIYISKYIYERKLYKYIVGVLIGSLFHQSILFMIPFYFINKIKINYKKYFIILFTFIIFKKYILNIFIIIINLLNSKYIYYVKNEFYKISSNGNNLGILNIINLIILFIIFYFNKNNDDEKCIVSINMYSIYMLLYLSFSGSELIGRASSYFFIFGVVTIPLILNIKNKKQKEIIFILFIIFYSLYFSYNIYFYLKHPSELIIPYRCYFKF